jgi:hypothetical protein
MYLPRASIGARSTRGTNQTRPAARQMSAVPQLKPGHRPTAMLPPPPPRRETRNQLKPPAAFRPARYSSGTSGPLRSVTSTRTRPSAALTATVTVPPAAPDRLCRTLLPNSSLTSRAALSPHGCPGPSNPTANARATPARSARPATVKLSRISRPATSAPAFPGRPDPGKSPGPLGRIYGNARSTQRHTSSRNPPPARPVRGRPWKADGAHRPSWQPDAVRYMSVDTATQRSTAIQVTHDGTEKKRPASTRICS